MCYSKQKLRDQQISQTISEKQQSESGEQQQIQKLNGHATTGTGQNGASAVISVQQKQQSELPK